jgi:putative redox protein
MAPRIERITFPGSQGADLAARLDLPAGPARAFAVFAHCFTCSKDLRAASRIATALTEAGYGVLRFDFTGLGQSEGEFANTNFSSNSEDLIAAAEWLGTHHRAPQLLVGHSLGGSAVLAMAAEVPSVRAVVTIGAPADPAHVTGVFEDSIGEIEQEGAADVQIAGRPFTIRRQFLDDLRAHVVTERVGTMGKALLVLHSPIDEVVAVDNAGRIFDAARHPRSFVALDGADHLLTRPADAAYAASMISAFANRYVDDERVSREPPRPSAPVVVAETTTGRFLNHVVVGRHRLLADEPESVGGYDAGPSPYDFLGAALGSCTSMTLRIYADRKKLPLGRVLVEVSHAKVHADDLADDLAELEESEHLRDRTGMIDHFERVLILEGDDLSPEDVDRLVAIADKCPVHRTMSAASVIRTRLAK